MGKVLYLHFLRGSLCLDICYEALLKIKKRVNNSLSEGIATHLVGYFVRR
jgi:hypothetical protein